MPGKVKVKIVRGRNLPVMDRTADTTDAYVEVTLGNVTYKTDVFRKSLNPEWKSGWFRFEVDDHELQDEPLQIQLMDHDTYSANDAIGKVYINLNPLLIPSHATGRYGTGQTMSSSNTLNSAVDVSGSAAPHQTAGSTMMSGWLPVYDTMHGIRGEVEMVVKVDLISDYNRFRQSSCGIQFFFSPSIPSWLHCVKVVGLVEELAIDDDPEYEWRDKIRSNRASNEAKQALFCKLSGYVQRKIGLKVHHMGGNAVLGYRQVFDLEGVSGIVVRGLGTAVLLTSRPPLPLPNYFCGPYTPTVAGPSSCVRHHSSSPPHHFQQQIFHSFHDMDSLQLQAHKLRQRHSIYQSPAVTENVRSSGKKRERMSKSFQIFPQSNSFPVDHQSVMTACFPEHSFNCHDNVPLLSIYSPNFFLSNYHNLFGCCNFPAVERYPSALSSNYNCCNVNHKVRSFAQSNKASRSINAKGFTSNGISRNQLEVPYSGASNVRHSSSRLKTNTIGALLAKKLNVKQNKDHAAELFVLQENVCAQRQRAASFSFSNSFQHETPAKSIINDACVAAVRNSNFINPVDKISESVQDFDQTLTQNYENLPLFIYDNGIEDEKSSDSFQKFDRDSVALSSLETAEELWTKEDFCSSVDSKESTGSEITALTVLDGRKFKGKNRRKKPTRKYTNFILAKINRRTSLMPEKLHRKVQQETVTNEWNSPSSSGNAHSSLKRLFHSAPNISQTNFVHDWFYESRHFDADSISSCSFCESASKYSGSESSSSDTEQKNSDFEGFPSDLNIAMTTSDKKDKTELFDLYCRRRKQKELAHQMRSSQRPYFYLYNDDKVPNSRFQNLSSSSSFSSEEFIESSSFTAKKFARPMWSLRRKRNKTSVSESSTKTVIPTPKFKYAVSYNMIAQTQKQETAVSVRSEDDAHKNVSKVLRCGSFTNLMLMGPKLSSSNCSLNTLSAALGSAGGASVTAPVAGIQSYVVSYGGSNSPYSSSPPNYSGFACGSFPGCSSSISPFIFLASGYQQVLKQVPTMHSSFSSHPVPRSPKYPHKHCQTNKATRRSRHHSSSSNVAPASAGSVASTAGAATFSDSNVSLGTAYMKMDGTLQDNDKMPCVPASSCGESPSALTVVVGHSSLKKSDMISNEFNDSRPVDTSINILPSKVIVHIGTAMSTPPCLTTQQVFNSKEDDIKEAQENQGHVINVKDGLELPLMATMSSNSSAKHEIVDNFIKEERSSDHVSVFENFDYSSVHIENRKIQRTATIIEQEMPLLPSNAETTFSVVQTDKKSTVVTVNPDQAIMFPQTHISVSDKKIAASCHSKSDKEDDVTTHCAVRNSPVNSGATCSGSAVVKAVHDAGSTIINVGTPNPYISQATQSKTSAVTIPGKQTGCHRGRVASPPIAVPLGVNQGHGAPVTGDEIIQLGSPPTGFVPGQRRYSDCEGSSAGIVHVKGVNGGRHSVAGPPPLIAASVGAPLPPGASVGTGAGDAGFLVHPLISYETLCMLKYPFFTMTSFPAGFILRIGGTVMSRSVKVFERTHSVQQDTDERNLWWAQLRAEVRLHARALGCNAVVGYEECTAIFEEVCILSASGTAAVISVSGAPLELIYGSYGIPSFAGLYSDTLQQQQQWIHHLQSGAPAPVHHSSSFEKKDGVEPCTRPRVASPRPIRRSRGGSLRGRQTSVSDDHDSMGPCASTQTSHRTPSGGGTAGPLPQCSVCHSPFADMYELPFRVAISKCAICKQSKVSDIILATIEPPPGIPIKGRGTLVQARVFKYRRDLKGEQFAKEVSDALPFVEYEITRQIINKVRIAGMNAVFGLRVRLSVGERLVVGVASGTAVHLTPLPPPTPPQVSCDGYENELRRLDNQKLLNEAMRTNMRRFGLMEKHQSSSERRRSPSAHESDDSDDENVIPGADKDTLAHAASAAAASAGEGATGGSSIGSGGQAGMSGGTHSCVFGNTDVDFCLGNKEACLLELDDSEDADMVSLLLNSNAPAVCKIPLVTTQFVPGVSMSDACYEADEFSGLQLFTKIHRETFPIGQTFTQLNFNTFFDNVIYSICYRMRRLRPCAITGLRFDVDIPDGDELQITVLGSVIRLPSLKLTLTASQLSTTYNAPAESTATAETYIPGETKASSALQPLHEMDSINTADECDLVFKMEGLSTEDAALETEKVKSATIDRSPHPLSVRKTTYASSSSSSSGSSSRPQLQHQARVQATPSLGSFQSMTSSTSGASNGRQQSSSVRGRQQNRADAAFCSFQPKIGPSWRRIHISPFPFIPGWKIEHYMGNLNFFFIRESNSIKEYGGVSVLTGSLVTEVLGIVRAHVESLGGTAIVSFFISQCILDYNVHKNQGQFMINVGGDVVYTTPLKATVVDC